MKYLTLAVVAAALFVFGQTALAQTSAPDPLDLASHSELLQQEGAARSSTAAAQQAAKRFLHEDDRAV